MVMTPEDLLYVERTMRELTAHIAQRLPSPKFGHILIIYEDKGPAGGGWTSYSMSGSGATAQQLLVETAEQMKTMTPIIDPLRGDIINFPKRTP